MLRKLVSVVLCSSYVSALAFPGPQPTIQVGCDDLVFPPEPTVKPKFNVELLKRADVVTDLLAPDNTCGYISGLPGAVYSCYPNTYLCAFFPGTSTFAGYLGCCDPDTFKCGARYTCIDRAQYLSSSCDNGCVKDTFTLKCTASTAPYCNGIKFGNENVEDFFCDSLYVSTWQQAFTTYNGEKDGRVFSSIAITLSGDATGSGSSVISIKPKTTKASAQTSAQTSDEDTATTPPDTATTDNPTTTDGGAAAAKSTSASPSPVPSGSSTPVGAIAGGVVGGVAGIGLIAAGIFFLVRHNKKKDGATAAAATGAGGAPPPTLTQPADPNNQSAYVVAGTEKPAAAVQGTAIGGYYAPNSENGYQQVPQQQYSPQMQQQPYPPMAEVEGSQGQYPPQNLAPGGYYNPNQSPQTYYSQAASQGQVSPNTQAHLSTGYPDRGETTSPLSVDQRRASEMGMGISGVSEAPSSPAPTFVSNAAAAGGSMAAPRPYVEGRAEMSANMTGPFPSNLHDGTYEIAGSEPQRH